MFTGLIRAVGSVRGIRRNRGGIRIEIFTEGEKIWPDSLRNGDSVAINGICLSVVEIKDRTFAFEAVPETVSKTTLGQWIPGRVVHLERALRLDDRLDGHWVSGHVDGVAEVRNVNNEGASKRIRFAYPEGLGRYIAPKGSVTLDGVSLTVAESLEGNQFTVAVIPETLRSTCFNDLRTGACVNLEVDILARYLEHLAGIGRGASKLTWAGLRSAGF